MPNYVKVTFKNSGTSQHVYTITDNVIRNNILDNQPLAPEETFDATLTQGSDGHGHATYGYSGGVQITKDDLDDGESIDMS